MANIKNPKQMAKNKKSTSPTVSATKKVKAKATNQKPSSGSNMYKPSKPVDGVRTVNQGAKTVNALERSVYSEKNSAKLFNKMKAEQSGQEIAKKAATKKAATKKLKSAINLKKK